MSTFKVFRELTKFSLDFLATLTNLLQKLQGLGGFLLELFAIRLLLVVLDFIRNEDLLDVLRYKRKV